MLAYASLVSEVGMTSEQEQDLVGVSEGERLTGLSRATLYKLARQGRIRSFKVLTALRFRRADLMALVCERRSGPVEDGHS
jgi:excisionase family DNA binding protein